MHDSSFTRRSVLRGGATAVAFAYSGWTITERATGKSQVQKVADSVIEGLGIEKLGDEQKINVLEALKEALKKKISRIKDGEKFKSYDIPCLTDDHDVAERKIAKIRRLMKAINATVWMLNNNQDTKGLQDATGKWSFRSDDAQSAAKRFLDMFAGWSMILNFIPYKYISQISTLLTLGNLFQAWKESENFDVPDDLEKRIEKARKRKRNGNIGDGELSYSRSFDSQKFVASLSSAKGSKIQTGGPVGEPRATQTEQEPTETGDEDGDGGEPDGDDDGGHDEDGDGDGPDGDDDEDESEATTVDSTGVGAQTATEPETPTETCATPLRSSDLANATVNILAGSARLTMQLDGERAIQGASERLTKDADVQMSMTERTARDVTFSDDAASKLSTHLQQANVRLERNPRPSLEHRLPESFEQEPVKLPSEVESTTKTGTGTATSTPGESTTPTTDRSTTRSDRTATPSDPTEDSESTPERQRTATRTEPADTPESEATDTPVSGSTETPTAGSAATPEPTAGSTTTSSDDGGGLLPDVPDVGDLLDDLL